MWSAIFMFVTMALLGGVAPASDRCADAVKSHQFDFWIGEWEVTANGVVAGYNRIEPIMDGCALQENWQSVDGTSGVSLNYYDPRDDQWHQYWLWQNGTTLPLLSGRFTDGKMLLSGKGKNGKGEMVHSRITWTDNPDGTVRQLWEISKDSEKTWQVVFDGLYRKKPKE